MPNIPDRPRKASEKQPALWKTEMEKAGITPERLLQAVCKALVVDASSFS